MTQRAVEQALIQAILAEPDDDSLRLVYADWLEDHGDEGRAARVRLECQAARLPDYDPCSFDVRDALGEYREKGLDYWTCGSPHSVRGLDWCVRDVYYAFLEPLPDFLVEGRAECLWCFDNRGRASPNHLRRLLEAFPSERLPRLALEECLDGRSAVEEAAGSGRLAGLRDLTVFIGWAELPPADLAASLAELPRLESLRLGLQPPGPGHFPVEPEDLRRGCGGLRRLTLLRSGTDPLPGLADALPHLESLSLAEAQIAPSLPDLPPRLRELYLPATPLTAERLPRLERLERLDLGGGLLGDLSALAELGQLRVVNLSTVEPLPSTGIGLWPPRFDPFRISVFGKGRPSRLSPRQPARLDLAPLRGLPQLEAIDARGHAVRLADLLPLPKLRAIRLSGPEVDDEAVERLAADCPALTAVELHNTSITDAGVRALSALPLASLRLGSCWLISDEGVEALAGCATLREVALADTVLGHDGLAALGQLPRLTRLDIRQCESLTPAALPRIASFPALRSLAYGDWPGEAPDYLAALASVPDLETEIVARNERGFAARWEALRQVRPDLHYTGE